ncbi:prenyltransferase [Methanophagales archaeon]|nr:MAG: prenyltransferase [Methanophagales archaeon]
MKNLWLIKKLKTIRELTRLEHGLMYGCGVIIGIVIAGGSSYEPAILGFLTAFFIQAGTFALNDYCDLESDIANQRMDRPLVRGEIREEDAVLIACLATTIGIVFAIFLSIILKNPIFFLIAFILATFGVLYDIKIKEFLAVSNFYIAGTMAIPFIYGGLITEPDRIEVVLPILILSAIAFFAGLGREVMKDIADAKGDEVRNVRSIARVYGMKKARNVTIFSYSLAVILSVVPFFLGNTPYFFNPAYILPVMAADALFVHTCFGLRNGVDINYNYMRKETLIALAMGLIAFISGALV